MGLIRSLVGASGVAKAAPARPMRQPSAAGPKRWSFDPHTLAWNYAAEVPDATHPGTFGLTYDLLHAMSRVPIVGAIIQTRINQVADFARIQPNPYAVGFQILMRDRRKTPNAAARKAIEQLTNDVILTAGGKYQPGGFEAFLRMITRDSLTYDQVNFEVFRERKTKLPAGFVPTDPATIRRAKPTQEAMDRGQWDPDKVTYLQIMDQEVVNEFGREEMSWGVRRHRSWTHAKGYGYPEIEELMGFITHLLNAETYNAVQFTTGINADSILTLSSDMDTEMFRAFQIMVAGMLSGVSNSRRTPLIQLNPELKEELKVVQMGKSNREMEYEKWINWLLKVVCSVFQMDPAELGFVFGNEGQSSSMGSMSVAERVAASKDKGLRPLLRAIEFWLNEMVIYPWDPDFELEFMGFDSRSEEEKLEMDVKAVKAFRSPNELRKERDEKTLKLMAGEVNLFDLPLDPTVWNSAVQLAQAAAMQEQQDAGGDFFGGFTGDEGENGLDDFAEPGEAPEEEVEMSSSFGIDVFKGTKFGDVQGVDDLSNLLIGDEKKALGDLSKALARLKPLE